MVLREQLKPEGLNICPVRDNLSFTSLWNSDRGVRAPSSIKYLLHSAGVFILSYEYLLYLDVTTRLSPPPFKEHFTDSLTT